MIAALVCFGVLCLSTAVVCVLDDTDPADFWVDPNE